MLRISPKGERVQYFGKYSVVWTVWPLRLGSTKHAGEIHQGQEMTQDGQSRGARVAQSIKGGMTGDEVGKNRDSICRA